MPAPSLRFWQAADLPAIRTLTWRSWLATYSGFIPREDLRQYHDIHYTLKALQALFADESVSGFVAEQDGILAVTPGHGLTGRTIVSIWFPSISCRNVKAGGLGGCCFRKS